MPQRDLIATAEPRGFMDRKRMQVALAADSGPGSDDVNVDDLLAVINAWGACP